MIYFLSLLNAGDKASVTETNFQRIDKSLAFGLTPSLTPAGGPTTLLGPPTEGTFVLGQFWVDAALAIWRCKAAGTPGDWIQQAAAVVDAAPGGDIPANYLITMPGSNWAQFYWDGAAWQPVNLQP